MDDKTAVSQIKKGDLSGLEALVRCYQIRAVHAAFLILQDRSLAEDITQNAFLKVVDKIGQFDEQRPFAPWFFKIIVNDAVKTARKQNRLSRLDEESDEEAQTIAKWLVDPNPTPEQQVETIENENSLRRAIRLISPEQRAVIVMRYYLGMDAKEISARLERPVSTIKWWLRAARIRLATLLQPAKDTRASAQEVCDEKGTFAKQVAKTGGK